MRRLSALIALFSALVLVALPVAAVAQTPSSFEALTVSSTAVGISSTTWNTSPQRTWCLLTLADNEVRYRLDGPAPTASVGHVFAVGASLTLSKPEDIQRFRAIRTGSDGTLSITCK